MRTISRLLLSAALISLLSLGCQSSLPPSTPPTELEAVAKYEAASLELLNAVSSGQSLSEIGVQAHGLADLSQVIIGDFAVRYPPCGPYLNQALKVVGLLDSLTLAEIERDYHADGALPDAPAFCYNAKDLVVHPATVLLWVREPDGPDTRARISAEIQEVRTHLVQVRKLLEAD